MHKILLVTFFMINALNASTLNDLNITDDDFIKISHSPQKKYIFDRINELMILKKSLKKINDNFTKLNSVNDFFNEYQYIDDEKIYNKTDYWATRKEFILKGAGDCEDFVIAKYFTLLELGIEESKLSILHGIHNDIYHLVLAYQENIFSDVFILDSINKKILPLTKRNDFLTLYTLKTIDLKNTHTEKIDLQYISNYKWTKIYLKSKNLVN